jgi:nitrogen regulatory protein PII
MQLIKAIVRPNKVDEVREALEKLSISGMTVTEVRGHGKQKGHTAIYRGKEYSVSLLPKMEVELVVDDAAADDAVKAIIQAARTGEIGDGRVFVMPVDRLPGTAQASRRSLDTGPPAGFRARWPIRIFRAGLAGPFSARRTPCQSLLIDPYGPHCIRGDRRRAKCGVNVQLDFFAAARTGAGPYGRPATRHAPLGLRARPTLCDRHSQRCWGRWECRRSRSRHCDRSRSPSASRFEVAAGAAAARRPASP